MGLPDLVGLSAIIFVASSGCGRRVGLTVADASQGSGGILGGVARGDGSGGAGGIIGSGGVAGGDGSGEAGGIIGSGGLAGVGGSRVAAGSGGVAGSDVASGTGGVGGLRTSAASGGNTGSGGASQCTTNQCEAFGSSCMGTEVPVSCIEAMPDAISEGRNPSCEEVCGTKCCTGIGPCKATAIKCPSGQLCAYPDAMEDTTNFVAKCMPEQQTCGGVSNKPCPDDQYCELFGILCSQPPTLRCPSTASPCDYAGKGGVGICRMKPPDSQCAPGVQPVCGCDGVTYPSPCARIAAGAFLAHAGSCSLDGGTDILDAKGQ
jgi:hypothetical protein